MQLDQELSHMDRLTQTQNSIDDLLRIASSSISYLQRNAGFKPLNANFPVTQAIPGVDSREDFEASKLELASDFVRKAKQLEFLIESLPASAPGVGAAEGTEQDEKEFRELEEEMRRVNEEYGREVAVAEELHQQLEHSLRGVLETRGGTATTTTAPSS